jgi:tyrosine-protein kinase
MDRDLRARSTAGVPSWASQPPSQPEENVLAPYVDAIRSHLLLVVAVMVAAVVGSLAWIAQKPLVYEATAELLVTPFPSDQVSLLGLPLLTQAGDPTRTIQTAASLVDTYDAATAAAQRLGEGWTPRHVRRATDVIPLGQTNILAVTATSENSDAAAGIANAFTRSVLQVRNEALRRQASDAIPGVEEQLKALEPASPAAADLQSRLSLLRALSTGKDPTLSISELAVPPANPEGSPRWLIVALAALAGLILGTGAALFLELKREVVRTEDDLVRLFPLPVLARVPKVSRRRSKAGVPQLARAEREAFRTVQVQLDMRGKHRRTVMLVSSSRGEGKTRAAAAFGLELADAGASVIVIDADLRGGAGTLRAALGLNVDGARPTWSDAVDRTWQFIKKNWPPVRVEQGRARPARRDPGDPDVAVPDPNGLPPVAPVTELLQPAPGRPSLKLLDFGPLTTIDHRHARRLSDLIAASRNLAEYTIVDTPPLGEVSDALTLLDVVDDVILVSELSKTRRLDLEVTRDLLLRADAQPTGLVVIRGAAR